AIPQREARSDVLEAAARQASPASGTGLRRLIGLDGHCSDWEVGEFAGGVVAASDQVAVDDQGAADAGSQRHQHERADPSAGAAPGLAQSAEVDVVVD